MVLPRWQNSEEIIPKKSTIVKVLNKCAKGEKNQCFNVIREVSDPKRVLVVCFGMGTTVRSASRFSASQILIDAVDIIPRVFDCFGYFHTDAEKVKAQENINLYAEDGRNFLLVRNNLYDVITIDPAPPIYSAGTVNLYTQEFLELCKSRINKHGVVCLWLPPGPASELLMLRFERSFLSNTTA